MKSNYDFSKGTRNPYSNILKTQITIDIDGATLEYFKNMAEEYDLPYQTVIGLYLLDCKNNKRRLRF